MAKLISDKPKKRKRGRPATGKDPLVGVRMAPELRHAVEAWAAKQPDKPSLSEAIRHHVQRSLAAESAATKPRHLVPDEKDRADSRSIREARDALEHSREKIELALAALARLVERSLASESAAVKPRRPAMKDKT
jgi:hypothetical protein